MLVIFFLISFKKQASCKFINFAQVFVNVGSEMAYRLPLQLLKNASLLWHSVKRLMSRAFLDSTT